MKLEPGNEYVKIEMRNQSCTHQEVLVFSAFCNVTEYMRKAVGYDPFQFWNRPDKIPIHFVVEIEIMNPFQEGWHKFWFEGIYNIATYLVNNVHNVHWTFLKIAICI